MATLNTWSSPLTVKMSYTLLQVLSSVTKRLCQMVVCILVLQERCSFFTFDSSERHILYLLFYVQFWLFTWMLGTVKSFSPSSYLAEPSFLTLYHKKKMVYWSKTTNISKKVKTLAKRAKLGINIMQVLFFSRPNHNLKKLPILYYLLTVGSEQIQIGDSSSVKVNKQASCW